MRMTPVLASAGGVLVASPSLWLREQVRHSLGEQNPPLREATGGADALLHLASGTCQLLYLDRQLRDLDPAELILIIKQRFPAIAVVMLDSESARPIPGITPESTDSGAMACAGTTTRTTSALASKGGAPLEGGGGSAGGSVHAFTRESRSIAGNDRKLRTHAAPVPASPTGGHPFHHDIDYRSDGHRERTCGTGVAPAESESTTSFHGGKLCRHS
jgi:hypothetical protein